MTKLRDEGLDMTQAYAAAPKCGTSRYSTVTGRYPTRSSIGRKTAKNNGVNPAAATIPNTKLQDVGPSNIDDGFDCSVGNIAQVFKANNYTTGMVGKWHLTKIRGGSVADIVTEVNACGFMDVEAMYPDNLDLGAGWSTDVHHNMEYVAYKAVEFIEDNKLNDWFLYMNPTVPHGPSVSDAMDLDCRVTVDGDFTSSMASGWSVIGMTAEFNDDCVAYRNDVRNRANNSTNDEDLGAIWVDDAIGAIYKALERTSQLDDTIILFQLDHGRHKKDKIWEGGIRIPQFVHYPAGLGTAPRTFDGMVSTIDIGPTLLDFAGIDSNSAGWYSMDGKSWKDAIDNLNGSGDAWVSGRCLFFESSEDRAVRCGCEKYMLLSASSPEAAEADASGWWDADTEALFDLCDSSGSYIVADEFTHSPEADNILSNNTRAKADSLRDLLQCHLDRTDAAIAPLYQECTGDIATPSPTVTPKPTLPSAPIGGVPQYVDSYPWEDDILASDPAMLMSATALDDNLNRVRFLFRLPNGTRTSYGDAVASQVSNNGDQTTWEVAVDTTVLSGKYRYRIEMRDDNNNMVEYPSNSTWFDFVVADTAAELVAAAREEIAGIIDDFDDDLGNLAAKFVRHGFHDCVGGCDGCVDMTNGDNAGLDIPIASLEPVVNLYAHPGYGFTRADIWVLAALEGASGSQPDGGADNREFAMDWIGRPTCETLNTAEECIDELCTQDRGPHRDLPSPNLDTKELLEYFETEFGFDERDTVAIMGAHTLGKLYPENSGYDGLNGWLGNTRQLENGYYEDLVGGAAATDAVEELMKGSGWEMAFVNNENFTTPNRWQWERGTNPNHFVMVNSDMAIVRNLTGQIEASGEVNSCQFRCNRPNPSNCPRPACPYAPETIFIAAEYKFDNALWLEEFELAFKLMVETGPFDTSQPCAEPPCVLQSLTTRKN